MARIREDAPAEVKIVLIGNKADLEDKREVSYNEGLELSKKLGYSYLETSARTGNNVENAFHLVASEIKKL